MGIITVTRQYGSKGSEIGQRIAQEFGYRCLDKNMPQKLAQMAQVSEAEAFACDERGASGAGYFFNKYFCAPHAHPATIDTIDDLWSPLPHSAHTIHTEYFDEDMCAQYTRDLILQEADQDNVVIVGRGAAKLLDNHPNVLHVCVFAPQPYRTKTLMMRYGISAKEAAKKAQIVDRARLRFVKRHYHVNLEDASQYHVLINTGKTDIESAIKIIKETAQHQTNYKSWPQAASL